MSNELVNKFTLSTGKVIYLKEGSIEDLENATKIAGKKCNIENQLDVGMVTQKELAKSLLVGYQPKDGSFKRLGLAEKENINGLFNLREYSQLLKAVSMVTGESSDAKQMTTDFVALPSAKMQESSGDK